MLALGAAASFARIPELPAQGFPDKPDAGTAGSANSAIKLDLTTNGGPLPAGNGAMAPGAGAVAGVDDDAALHALLQLAAEKATLKGGREGQLAAIRVLAPQMEKASPRLRALLAAGLAHAWNAYYRENLWTLFARSADMAPDDAAKDAGRASLPAPEIIQTWDAARVREEIRRYYAIAFSDPAVLRATPVSVFDKTFPRAEQKGAAAKKHLRPDSLRPTLYDFLVHDAIAFLGDNQRDSHPSLDFDPLPGIESPVLGTLEEFLNWKPQAADPHAPDAFPPKTGILGAIALYQSLLRFRIADTANPAPLADADLSRILWAARLLQDAEGVAPRVEQALRAHLERWKDHEAAAETAAELALFLRSDEKRPDAALEAYRVATLGVSLQPQSDGARRCRDIIAELDAARLLDIATESSWADPLPDITVRYQNLKTIHFRVIPGSDEASDAAAPPNRKPALEWKVALPASNYAPRAYSFPAPSGLAPGLYHLVASPDADFGKAKSATLSCRFRVSNLAIFSDFAQDTESHAQGRAGAGFLQGFVLDARTGQPIPGVDITAWRHNRDESKTPLPGARTNADGAFSIRTNHLSRTRILAADPATGHKAGGRGDSLDGGRSHDHSQDAERTRLYVHFLTDRTLYRPGQEVRFKAVVFRANKKTNEYAVAAGRRITVALVDPNGKDVATLVLRTNANGGASGHFTLPASGFNGLHALRSVGAENGRGHFRVEEYKRPKFEAGLFAPAAPPALGQEITVPGRVVACTGTPVHGARVRYTVRRETRWPRWCWWNSGAGSNARQLATGHTSTDANGAFSVTFPAAPDKEANPDEQPVFHYVVSAEVTDATGETRAVTRTIRAGHAMLEVGLSAGAWQTSAAPVSVKIRATTLDDVPAAGISGRLAVYSLRQPDSVVRRPLRAGSAHFPDASGQKSAARSDLSDPRNWEEDEGVAAFSVTTKANGEATIPIKLPAGIYRMVLTAADSAGSPVTARAEVAVRDLGGKSPAIRVPFAFVPEKTVLRPGETFTAIWSSGYASARARVEIRHRQKLVHSFWTTPGHTQQLIRVPVTEAHRGGFEVSVWQVSENRLYRSACPVEVPWDNKALDMTWERFRSKLTPGASETWTLKIKPSIAGANPVNALPELAAALYDASLDRLGGGNIWNPLTPFHQEFARGARPDDPAGNSSRSGSLSNTMRHAAAQERGVGWRHGAFPRLPGREFRYFDGQPSAQGVPPRPARHEEGVAAASMPDPQALQTPVSSLDAISPRANLNETAFFFPALAANPDGTVRLEFSVPEALTRWRFLAFAHDAEMRSGVLTDDSIVTNKTLMTQPSPPRFLREGDEAEISVKLTNKGGAPLAGRVRLNFSNALTLDAVDGALGNSTPEHPFSLAPNSSRTVAWRVRVPEGTPTLVYKAVAAAGLESDGEEGFLPVLPRRQLVTESRAFTFPPRDAGSPAAQTQRVHAPAGVAAPDARPESLTLQAGSAPAWAAILALPGLMESGYECSEQLFDRFYANAISRHLAASHPSIARVFKHWRDTRTLTSALSRDAGVRDILLAEIPWVRDAEGEAAQRHNLGALLDATRNESEMQKALGALASRQNPDGSWPWLPGGPGNPHITRLVVVGFGRLQNIGAAPFAATPGETKADRGRLSETANGILRKACAALDNWLLDYDGRMRAGAGANQRTLEQMNPLSPDVAHCLYARSFFSENGPDGARARFPLSGKAKEVYDFYLALAIRDWRKLPLRSRAHVAIVLHRRARSTPVLVALPSSIARESAPAAPEKAPPASPPPMEAATETGDPAAAVVAEAGPSGAIVAAIPGLDESSPAAAVAVPVDDVPPAPPAPAKPVASVQAAGPPPETKPVPSPEALAAGAILDAVRQNLKTDEPEAGAHWPQQAVASLGAGRDGTPVGTHVLLMEAFNEIAPSPSTHAALQLWLLRQKQGSVWPGTKSTTDAIHALLLQPGGLALASSAKTAAGTAAAKGSPAPHHPLLPPSPPPLVFTLGGTPRPPRAIEAGTGFHRERIPAAKLSPAALRDVSVTRPAGASGPAWGSVTWQYFQSIGDIAPHSDTPLRVRKRLFKKVATARGTVLLPLPAGSVVSARQITPEPSRPRVPAPTVVGGAMYVAPAANPAANDTRLAPGDTLVVRLEITASRDMEFIHVKDQRAAGVEPENVISGYRWRGGIGFHESARDSATHFFLDRLPRGTHVIEYSVRARHRGLYEAGVAWVQSMYAPGLNAHSASALLRVE
ncbi:MAG: hypothetical protein LBG65_03935 [Puniceicoccales bacterium]|nr:hypothetical protein [Puniceicoccales bacterium]